MAKFRSTEDYERPRPCTTCGKSAYFMTKLPEQGLGYGSSWDVLYRCADGHRIKVGGKRRAGEPEEPWKHHQTRPPKMRCRRCRGSGRIPAHEVLAHPDLAAAEGGGDECADCEGTAARPGRGGTGEGQSRRSAPGTSAGGDLGGGARRCAGALGASGGSQAGRSAVDGAQTPAPTPSLHKADFRL